MADFLLYGAYGYTGKIICARARAAGLTPLLAGRAAAPLAALAKQYGYAFRCFSLDDAAALEAALREVPVVLHAAGPFIRTAAPVAAACLRTRTHYLDITGEIDVFERLHALDAAARRADITLLPGAGFDVVPTDCMAAYLHGQLPSATQLQLAFATVGGRPSRGTLLTAVEQLGQPGKVRRDGRIVDVPAAYRRRRIDFPNGAQTCVTIPWGDVSTAYHTTGIPNIETYIALPDTVVASLRLSRYLGPLLRRPWLKVALRRHIGATVTGPTAEERATAGTCVWGRVSDASGNECTALLQLPETYRLTATTALLLIQKVKNNEAPTGFQTPAGAFGVQLIDEVPGVGQFVDLR